MKLPLRTLCALVAPLLLTACFFTPGKFASDMTVAKDGQFTFAYKGEILFLTPDEMKRAAEGDKPEPVILDAPSALDEPEHACWDDKGESHKCTAAELKQMQAEEARQKADREERDKKEQARFMQMFGMNPEDPASMQRFATNLTKHAGWKSAVYKGHGVFEVDYRITSTLDRDFVWPVYPDTSMAFPMVVVRKRADGSVQISAPAFANSAGGPAMLGLFAGMDGKASDMPKGLSRTEGTFTITTDAEILTNNMADAPTKQGDKRVLSWQVAPGVNRPAPETLLQVK
jgi:hypothetical protein